MRTWIDVHHHVRTAEMIRAAASAGVDLGGSRGPWTPGPAIEGMDATGIAASVLSPIIFITGISDAAAATAVLRETNDVLAALVAGHPARFGAFAPVPIADADAAIAEIGRALDTLRLDGILLPTSLDGELIGSPRFDPILAELDRRQAVVHLHPTTPPNAIPGLAVPVEFMVETTRAIGSMLVSGAFHRYPGIRWIVSHGGGAFPYIVGRVARSDRQAPLRENAPLGTAAYLRRLHYDVAVCCHPTALPSLLTVTTPDHLIFGTDMPAFSNDEVRDAIRFLEVDYGFRDAEVDGIASGNAVPFFPRLTSAMGL